MQTFNKELLSVAKEQHQQLGAHTQYSRTDSASEAEEHGGTRPKTETTSVVNIYSDKADQLVKSAKQIHRNKKKEKLKAQTEVIEWQKKEIKNLKATSMQMDLKKMIEAMTQAMAYM